MSATAANGSVFTGATSTTTVTTASSSASSFFIRNLSSLGLGYAIAIALGFLVLLSTLLLASYVCCRASRRTRNPGPATPSPAASDGVVLPRIIFVAEDDDDDDHDNDEDEEEGTGRARRSAQGLDLAAISSYPTSQYSAAKSSGDNVCAICLGEYKDGETLRMMPDCRHCFHLPCIDAWLRLNASCPVCRTSPMPTPLSTPLSELVPLSHFPAGHRRR